MGGFMSGAGEFLTGLAGQLEDQFGLGENKDRSLDIAQDGTAKRYGKLGDFASKFDQTQERKYLEEGYLRFDQFNVNPKQLEILFQEPDITVLVKKRAFCSLAENFAMDHMDKDEKLFYKATKILFANKCKQIAAFERLTKIERVSTETGQLSAQLVPLIISLVDEIDGFGDSNEKATDILTGNSAGGMTKLKSVIDKIKKVYSFTPNNFYTTWLTNNSNPFKSQFGEGTGVLELTNVISINTTTTVSDEGGNAGLTLSNPYNMMMITSSDIERALSDATNQVYNGKAFQFAQPSEDDIVARNIKKLNDKRAGRGASAIQFITSPDTLLSKRVRALIEGVGEEINFTYEAAAGLAGLLPGLGGTTVAPESLKGSETLGDEGLDTGSSNVVNGVKRLVSESELSLFTSIIQSIFTSLQLKRNSQSITKQNSELTNYARKKLRLHYGGKLLIQPMDQVHIYISSKARLDNKITGGLQNSFTGLNFLQKISHTASDFKNQFDSLFNPSSNVNFQLEKNIYVGPDFPNWLWTILKNQFVNDTSGPHVFAGVVNDSGSSFRDGKYSVSIGCSDMLSYLRMGRVNTKPAIDVFNGPLYDPLTPFKTRFDSTSSEFKSNNFPLLDENKAILATNSLRFKAGHNAGKIASEKNLATDTEIQKTGNLMKVFYAPDGLVYKWKEGIGTLTQFSDSLVIQGDNSPSTPSLTKEPFAGQDIMNIISLSITGIPYNYATFYKAAREVDSFGRDPQSGADAAFSYYKSLTSDLSKNNLLWGNFIPFKNLVMDESTYKNVITAQMTILNKNDQIDQKLKSIQELTGSLQFASSGQTIDNSSVDTTDKIKQRLQVEKDQLTSLYTDVQTQLASNGKQGLSLVGDDVSFEYDSFLNNDNVNNESLSQPSLRKDLRRKLNALTRRLSWQVRANEDKSFLIIDDTYDKDYDMQAFEKNLTNDISLFNSDFTSVIDKIQAVAQLLNLEVFCDPQGHIRVRPPLYNRMPSSVFNRLFQLKQSKGIQIFPQFLEDLFINQLDALVNRLEVLEDQIRLDASLLGKSDDFSAAQLIQGFNGGNGSLITTGEGQFTFLTSESNGSLIEFNALKKEANPDDKINKIDNTIDSRLKGQTNLSNVFNTVQRAQFLVANFTDVTTPQIAQNRKDKLIERLTNKTGQQVKIDEFESPNIALAVTNPSAKVPDPFKIAKDISIKLAERQKTVKLLAKSLTNARESIQLDNKNTQDTTVNSLLFPDVSQNRNVPEIFESMVEDESYDDLGPNSGQRYIIKDHNIISYTFREVPPEYTMVEVKGQLDLFLPNDQLPSELNTFAGGNALISASAIDYDMWRMYGFKSSSPISAPFLSDPQSQCAPYASTVLSRARKNILRAQFTIVGNEYSQPGDTVYVESFDLLFYVSHVRHSFTYNGAFQTDLELIYGHCPGDYIPTTLDVIGKLLYNNRDVASYTNYRQASSFNQQSLGTIILDKRKSLFGDDIESLLFEGTYGEHNSTVINDILYTSYFAIQSNKDPSSTIKPNIELRMFFNSKKGSVDPSLFEAAGIIKKVLTGNFEYKKNSAIGKTGKALDADDIMDPVSSSIDISGATEFRSPSQKAMDMARNISNSVSSKSGFNSASDQLNNALYSNIIDVWISFKNTAETTK